MFNIFFYSISLINSLRILYWKTIFNQNNSNIEILPNPKYSDYNLWRCFALVGSCVVECECTILIYLLNDPTTNEMNRKYFLPQQSYYMWLLTKRIFEFYNDEFLYETAGNILDESYFTKFLTFFWLNIPFTILSCTLFLSPLFIIFNIYIMSVKVLFELSINLRTMTHTYL